jgi:hypothetical protein
MERQKDGQKIYAEISNSPGFKEKYQDNSGVLIPVSRTTRNSGLGWPGGVWYCRKRFDKVLSADRKLYVVARGGQGGLPTPC